MMVIESFVFVERFSVYVFKIAQSFPTVADSLSSYGTMWSSRSPYFFELMNHLGLFALVVSVVGYERSLCGTFALFHSEVLARASPMACT